MTRYLNTIHRLLGSGERIAEILAGLLTTTGQTHILDLCSGSGGPMPAVAKLLREKYGFNDITLALSDLYPDQDIAMFYNETTDGIIKYLNTPVDVLDPTQNQPGIRTMICSFHHFLPENAHTILKNAASNRQPILIYEISDNSFPSWLWWIAIPINVISVLFLTPMVRPMSATQLIFTYLIPVLPLFIAWDGAVSNARTYTLSDLDLLLKDVPSAGYIWEKDIIKGPGGHKLYLLGAPIQP